MRIEVVQADYANAQNAYEIIMLLDRYAQDVMGLQKPLSNYVKKNLIAELLQRPYAFSLIAYDDGCPVGLMNCFEQFSTFECKPLINIHDVIVLESYRNHGVANKMLVAVQNIAQQKQCCKLTLEVLSNNAPAIAAYKNFGFEAYSLSEDAGAAMFWQKKL